ncbi:hypothetical protein ASPZODRAFT_747322 [Penicilliopsis zonata CBS 506.65]|uniref:Origin recognition complex subunit 2 n=1 Tax=Penicilliopsis zonata CBS 506.65 TaxID=1073090 RepID=A0A1L9SCC9_9EURO|nr:hypothetical protein ASPZODRAFT_747322 [Penicilliopsis zonata CBS 506.65]OJJ44836.1 hypothetical protein ASPZODRAFT_747322 [Penicilliopsis zonata CBS 506.65]
MRRQPGTELGEDQLPVSTPKRQKRTATVNYRDHEVAADEATEAASPSKRAKSTPRKSNDATATSGLNPPGLKTPTHKSKATSLFATPTKRIAASTPSRAINADRSAKRKSVRLLLEQDEDDVWDGADRLAEEILEEESESAAVVNENPDLRQTIETGTNGAKNKRSPTPEGELPPHERYFFQNRAGPPRTSNNNLNKVNLLTHEEYFEKLAYHQDPNLSEKDFLLEVHQRSFPQWEFELDEDFNVCLYGYGSKRNLVQQFADWLYLRRREDAAAPTIIIVNGYTPNISIRSIFATVATAVLGADLPSKLGSQPTEVLELLQSALKSRPLRLPVTVLINSIDAPPLRRAMGQALLARLAATPMIRVLATADTPNFGLMWDISLQDQLNFVFHDCTTFSAYEAEVDVVEEVHSLLGRKGRRVGGKDGVGFVLKSLPENARNLYRLLLTELITMLDEGHMSDDELEGEEDEGREVAGARGAGDLGIEFRTLYQKAAEEFIASSEMMFRTLLKEFHDHQMITSRMDSSGMEILGVPLSRDEMEGVLEDLVLA